MQYWILSEFISSYFLLVAIGTSNLQRLDGNFIHKLQIVEANSSMIGRGGDSTATFQLIMNFQLVDSMMAVKIEMDLTRQLKIVYLKS